MWLKASLANHGISSPGCGSLFHSLPKNAVVMPRIVLLAIVCLLIPSFAQAQIRRNSSYEQGVELLQDGKHQEAIAVFTKIINSEPRNADALHERAIAWHELGEFDKAIADETQAIKINPTDDTSYYQRGRSWLSKGDANKAISDFNEAIRLDKASDPEYIFYRGQALEAKGDYEKAIADYQKAISVDPKDPDFYNALAWLQATCPTDRIRNGKEAFKNASQAHQLGGGNDPVYMDTLAAAYAENGSFPQAQEWQSKAIELIMDEETKEDYRKRLALYKQNKPVRQEPAKP